MAKPTLTKASRSRFYVRIPAIKGRSRAMYLMSQFLRSKSACETNKKSEIDPIVKIEDSPNDIPITRTGITSPGYSHRPAFDPTSVHCFEDLEHVEDLEFIESTLSVLEARLRTQQALKHTHFTNLKAVLNEENRVKLLKCDDCTPTTQLVSNPVSTSHPIPRRQYMGIQQGSVAD